MSCSDKLYSNKSYEDTLKPMLKYSVVVLSFISSKEDDFLTEVN